MITLQTKDFDIKLHSSIDEISLNDFCDFMNAESIWMNAEIENKDELFVKMAMVFVPNANLLPFDSGSEDVMESLSLINVYIYYIDLLNGYFMEVIDDCLKELRLKDSEYLDEFESDIVETDVSKLSIVDKSNLAISITEHYRSDITVKDNNLSFEHNNETYLISGKLVNDYLQGNSFTAGEVATVKDFRRRLSEAESEKETPETGTLMFKLRLHDLAVLARKENEVLPFDISERTKLLNERMVLFQDLKMDLVFNISFFLTSLSKVIIQKAIIKDIHMEQSHLKLIK